MTPRRSSGEYISGSRYLKISAVLMAGLLVFFFFYLHWDRALTLENLKAREVQLRSWFEAQPLQFIFIYIFVYAVASAFSLPGAALLTLACGAIFGFWYGTLIASFASTIGATGAFLITRHLIKDPIQRRFGPRLEKINRGVSQNGTSYLFTLRLVPLFPYFLVNIAMGLTPMRTRDFFVISQVGMLPGTAVYVNAGMQLSRVDSLKGILTWPILLSLALLGTLPLLALRHKR